MCQFSFILAKCLSGSAGCRVHICFISEEAARLVPRAVVSVTLPWMALFSGAPSPFPLMAGVRFFDCSRSDGCVVLSPCGFNLHFWRTSEVEHFFHVLIGPSGIYTFDSSNLLPIFS